MPRHPRPMARPTAALLGTASALLTEVAGKGAVVRREAACGIAANNLLTGRALDQEPRRVDVVLARGRRASWRQALVKEGDIVEVTG